MSYRGPSQGELAYSGRLEEKDVDRTGVAVISDRRREQIWLWTLGITVRHGIIFTPVYQPSWSSNMWRCLCTVMLTADWSWWEYILYIIKMISERRGENLGLTADFSERLIWIQTCRDTQCMPLGRYLTANVICEVIRMFSKGENSPHWWWVHHLTTTNSDLNVSHLTRALIITDKITF